MEALVRHSGIAAPMVIDNVDTDQIIPSREMKRVSREGLGDGLFAGWRYRYDGDNKTGLRDDFVLNQPEYAGASIILGGRNWGCGSSREHAVWALHDFGIRVIIARSFGRIFRGNCARNGLLAIELSNQALNTIESEIAESPQSTPLLVDLQNCRIEMPSGAQYEFNVPEADRYLLLNGLDVIEHTLQYSDVVDAFVETDRDARPWAYLA